MDQQFLNGTKMYNSLNPNQARLPKIDIGVDLPEKHIIHESQHENCLRSSKMWDVPGVAPIADAPLSLVACGISGRIFRLIEVRLLPPTTNNKLLLDWNVAKKQVIVVVTGRKETTPLSYPTHPTTICT
jgi:hypothetical protein